MNQMFYAEIVGWALFVVAGYLANMKCDDLALPAGVWDRVKRAMRPHANRVFNVAVIWEGALIVLHNMG